MQSGLLLPQVEQRLFMLVRPAAILALTTHAAVQQGQQSIQGLRASVGDVFAGAAAGQIHPNVVYRVLSAGLWSCT